MDRLSRRCRTLLAAVLAALTLVVAPAAATEGEAPPAEGGQEERTKITLPDNPHDIVGLILIGLMGLGGLLALDNARRQLRGERKQATGEFRWR